MKNPFLVSLGHEIRAPMNSLIGVTESLLATDLTPAQRGMAEAARGAAEAMLEVINDLVVLSGIRDGHVKLERVNFDLAGLAGTAARLFAAEAEQGGLELDCSVAPDLPRFTTGDPGRLRQVLVALIGNAVKFTESGEVHLRVGLEARNGVDLQVRFTVEDTGLGMPPEKVQSLLNEPGQIRTAGADTRWEGEGYGLAVAQLILVLMGSRLEIESEPGRGSAFSFTLAMAAAVGAGSTAMPDNWLHLEGSRVLMVGDSPGRRRTVEEILGSAGVGVDRAADGATALSALSGAVAEGKPYQMAILDSYLPGSDCFELAAGIHAMDGASGLPLMILSSRGQPGDGERCRAAGVSAYLSMPVNRIELLQAAAELLSGGDDRCCGNTLITRFSMEENRRALRVLLVDGSPVNRQVATTMLHRRGHHVDVCGTVSEAASAMASSDYDALLVHAALEGADSLRPEAGTIRITLVDRSVPEESPCVVMPPEPMSLFAAVEGWGIPAPSTPSPEPVGGAEPLQERSPVNLEALTAMMRDAGIEDAVPTILQIFRNEGPAWMSALADAASRRDATAMAKAAHVFVSAAGSVKAEGLTDILRLVEDAGNRGDPEAAVGLVEDAGREYRAVESFLNPAGNLAPAT